MLLLCAAAHPAAAQDTAPRDSGPRAAGDVRLGVAPDTVLVGEPFLTAISIAHGPGEEIRFSQVPTSDSIQPHGPPRVTERAGRITVVYPLVAWIAGAELIAEVEVRRTADGETRFDSIAVALPHIGSILPDAGELAPRPARGVYPLVTRRRPWWMLAIAVLASMAAIAFRVLRRRADGEAGSPRDAALASLAALRASSAAAESKIEGGDGVLRGYARSVLRIPVGTTTTELTTASRSRLDAEDAAGLARLLELADRLKFSGRRFDDVPDPDPFLDDVEAWVRGVPEPDEAP